MAKRTEAHSSRWTDEMRFAASERMRARHAALSPKERAALTARQRAGRRKGKAGPASAEAGRRGAPHTRPPADTATCAGACPFVDQVVERLLERLPIGEDREAKRVAILALKMARTPSRSAGSRAPAGQSSARSSGRCPAAGWS